MVINIYKIMIQPLKLMTKFFNKNLFYLIFGFLFSSYIFYIRILLIRLPKDLFFFNPNNYLLWFISICWLFLSFFIIYKSVCFLRGIPNKEIYLQVVFIKVKDFIKDSLENLYCFIIKFIPNISDKVSLFSSKFYKCFGEIHEGFLFFISYGFRIIIALIFLVDVFCFFRLHYFYKSLTLLCIPLIINIIIASYTSSYK